MGYLGNFIVYTLAMVGVMMLALFVFKNATSCGKSGGAKHMKVLDTLSIGPRKTLYIVAVGEEKFLIAGDVDKTTLISKLGNCEEKIPAVMVSENKDYSTKASPAKSIYMDKSIVGIRSTQNTPYSSVMKNLAEKLKTGVEVE